MARLAKKKLIQALRENDGIIAQAAKACGVSRTAVYDYINKNDMWDEVDKAREELKDVLESKAIQLAKHGHNGMLQFLLKNIARDRGYSDRIEQSGDQTITVKYDRSPPVPTSPDAEDS